jgi:thiamine biosynthesis lipoprotein
MQAIEHRRTFPCFGSTCAAIVAEDDAPGRAAAKAAVSERVLRGWHARFTRFDAHSELSRLNADPRTTVPVTPLLGRLARLVADAGRVTDGLVDATVVEELEHAGYRGTLAAAPLDLAGALAAAPPRQPATGDRRRRWAQIAVDRADTAVTRPPGVRIDSGGLGKGLFADELGHMLEGAVSFVVDCGGDLLLGGRDPEPRPVQIHSPFDGRLVHQFALARGGIATSGIGRRSWRDATGAPAHHLLDPATGRPAFTGVVQASALAPTAAAAEVWATAAVLGGPQGLVEHLPHGGLAVLDDGSCVLVEAPAAARVALPALPPRS